MIAILRFWLPEHAEYVMLRAADDPDVPTYRIPLTVDRSHRYRYGFGHTVSRCLNSVGQVSDGVISTHWNAAQNEVLVTIKSMLDSDDATSAIAQALDLSPEPC